MMIIPPRTILLLSMGVFCVAGCRAVHAPAGYRSAAIATASDPAVSEEAASTETESDSIWPARWGDHSDRRGIVVGLDPTQRLRARHYSRYHQGRTTPEDYEDAAKLATAQGIESGFKFKVEGPGAFVFSSDTVSETPLKDPPAMAFKYISARETERDEESGEDHVELERTWFTFRDQLPDKPQLGTVILLPGMFGTPEPIVDATERYFTHEGYSVLRMLSHPSRFTQHTVLSYLDGRTESLAKNAAHIADQRIAECAYATDAALDHVFEAREDLRDKPVVLIGMSGGAMALPSVYAYSPDRYDAAVLIAGGANFLRIMIESNYRDWIDAILVDFDPLTDGLGKPDPAVVETLCERYLESSRLDAYHTAPLMRDLPVLMLHATSDKAVPSGTGDLLYRQLGQPERWAYPFGHELIFAGLPTQIPRIEKWVTEQLREASDE